MADDWDRSERPTEPPAPEPTNRDLMNAFGSLAGEVRSRLAQIDRLEANYELVREQATSNTKRISELEHRVDALEERSRLDS